MKQMSSQRRRQRGVDDKTLSALFPTLFDKGFDADVGTNDSDDPYVTNDGVVIDKDFDFLEFMKNSQDPVTGTIRDIRVDDRDMPMAKNFYDFSFTTIGKSVNPPWSRQLWISAVFFGEVCPYCSNKKWLKLSNVPKDYPSKDLPEHIMFLEHGICPKCKRTKYELWKEMKLKLYKELVLCLGQRSGKSLTAAFQSSYLLHKFLKFPKLSSLAPNALQDATPLSFTFVSLTSTKAIRLLWEPFMNIINSSSWFTQYFDLLTYNGKKIGVELFKKNIEFMQFYHKKFNLYPSNPAYETLRGDTRVLSVLDELGLFPLPTSDNDEVDSKQANPDEVHKSLSNSLTTVQSVFDRLIAKYPAMPPAVMIGVSSPFSERDKIMRLLRDSKKEPGKSLIMGVQKPTWEINPTIDRNAAMIQMAYASNPEKAERDYGANPPKVSSAYIKYSMIEHDVFVHPRNSHVLEYDYTDNEVGGKVRKVASVNHPTLMSMDAGHNDNSFTLNCFYFDFELGHTINTTVIEIMPTEGRAINFNKVYTNIILPIARDNHVQILLADRWNSLDILYRIKADIKGTTAVQYSPKRRDFDAVESMLKNKNLKAPKPEMQLHEIASAQFDDYRPFFINKPVSHLVNQVITVSDVHPQKPPIKAEGLTDDIFRSWILGASQIHNPKYQKILQDARITTEQQSRVAPIYISRGGYRR